MDTTDPDITFNEQGVCIRCREAEMRRAAVAIPAEAKESTLQALVTRIKAAGQGKDYDCVIGVSGGTDSTYVAYLSRKYGLRPLAVHLDNGWNSALAVSNIENCLKTLAIDLFTCVLDWDEFKDLQLAFLKASTPDSEIPTDHAIRALLMQKAAEIGVRFIITGENVATEGVNAPAWSQGHSDWRYIHSIHQQFGRVPLKTYPHYSLWDYFVYTRVKRQKFIKILNYVDYNKHQAQETLKAEVSWTPYTGKHHESVYTRFFQAYILPRKFGFDKRRMHLSDLILSQEISRSQALATMKEEIAPTDLVRQDKLFVAKKLGLNEAEFDQLMALPPKSFGDYPSYDRLPYIKLIKSIRRALAYR